MISLVFSWAFRRPAPGERIHSVLLLSPTLTKAFSDINMIFVERPELRPYFSANQEAVDPVERQRLLAIAGYIGDVAEMCIAVETVLPHLKGDWDDHFNLLYRNSPALRQWWAAMGHLYPEEVKRALTGPSLRPKKWPAPPSSSDLSPGTGGGTTDGSRVSESA